MACRDEAGLFGVEIREEKYLSATDDELTTRRGGRGVGLVYYWYLMIVCTPIGWWCLCRLDQGYGA